MDGGLFSSCWHRSFRIASRRRLYVGQAARCNKRQNRFGRPIVVGSEVCEMVDSGTVIARCEIIYICCDMES